MRHIEPLQSAGFAVTAAKREGRKPKPNRPRLPLLLVGLSVGLFVLTCCVELVLGASDVAATVIGAPGFGAATILALLGAVNSIQLLNSLPSDFTPELKAPNPKAKLQASTVFGSQAKFAQAMINDYKAARISPRRVWPQSFTKDDVLYWIANEPSFGRQAVYLDDAAVPADLPSAAELKSYRAQGIRIVAPPMWALLTTKSGKIVPSQFTWNVKAAKLDIITWTLERSGRIVEEVLPTKGTSSPSSYYQTTLDALTNDGDIMTTLDVLARQVGVLGVFSDWSGTVSYYASCMGLD